MEEDEAELLEPVQDATRRLDSTLVDSFKTLDASGGGAKLSAPAAATKVRPRLALDLPTATAALAASVGFLDLSEPSISARGEGGQSFIANFRQVTIEGTKARGRYLATRHQLDVVKRLPEDEGQRFAEDVEAAKAEVNALLDELYLDCQILNEVTVASMDISHQVEDLLDNDAKMSLLLDKMNRKLGAFEATLGNF